MLQILSLTQENAVDLHSVGSPLTLTTTVGGKHTDPVKNMSLYQCMSFFSRVSFTTSPKPIYAQL
jgi:hypothetical protein